mmetsp:Transcript_47409/g.132189  ORF Transcript_47409/g.132189 Transcript_47409/m.132189 type:complete len:253 (-) Transcript_47409:446-1204(-)
MARAAGGSACAPRRACRAQQESPGRPLRPPRPPRPRKPAAALLRPPTRVLAPTSRDQSLSQALMCLVGRAALRAPPRPAARVSLLAAAGVPLRATSVHARAAASPPPHAAVSSSHAPRKAIDRRRRPAMRAPFHAPVALLLRPHASVLARVPPDQSLVALMQLVSHAVVRAPLRAPKCVPPRAAARASRALGKATKLPRPRPRVVAHAPPARHSAPILTASPRAMARSPPSRNQAEALLRLPAPKLALWRPA